MDTVSDPAAMDTSPAPPATAASPLAGEPARIGPYRVLSKLGAGAMGAVYLGYDDEHARRVAIKVLPSQFADKADMVSRFRREATAAGTLRHANIIAAYRAGDDHGVHYYSMEYCDGDSLAQVLERDGPFSLVAVLPIMLQVVSALQHAHDHGFIHRDIKPSNIMVTKAGVAKILDLGLTKNIDDAQASFNTMTGMAMGTPHYISPEQARGEKTIDGRADIYSLGATLFHLLTGQTPFEGSTPAVIMTQHLTREAPDIHRLLPDLPMGVVYVVRRMMAKAPAQRHADCAALRGDFEALITGKLPAGMIIAHAAKNRSNPRIQPAEKRARRTRPLGMVVMVACVVLLVAGGAVFALGRAKTPGAPGLHQTTAAPPAQALAAQSRPELQQQQQQPQALPSLPVPTSAPAPATTPGPTTPAPTAPGPGPAAGGAARSSAEAWEESLHGKPAPEQLAAVIARLTQLNPGFDGKVTADYHDGAISSLKFSSAYVSDISPLHALHDLHALSCNGNWEHRALSSLVALTGMHLESLTIGLSKVEDLSPLSGMPLKSLFAEQSLVSDLSPLRGMKLEQIFLTGTPNQDLSPLKDMPLHHLHCGMRVTDLSPIAGMRLIGLAIRSTQIADLAPIAGMALPDYLFTDGNNVSDLRPLAGANLHKLIFTPKNIHAGIEVVRAMSSLAEIGVDWDKYWPTAEFWRRYDAGEFGAPPSAPVAPGPAAVAAVPAPAPAVHPPAPAAKLVAGRSPPAKDPDLGRILLQETFDAFNTAALPVVASGRWWLHGSVATVNEPGHGKVLKIVQRDGDVSECGISFALDPSLVAGRTIKITVAAKFPGGYAPVPDLAWKRPRLNVNGTDHSGKNLWSLLSTYVEPHRSDWQILTVTGAMPQDLASLNVWLIAEVPCEVYFDNLGIALVEAK